MPDFSVPSWLQPPSEAEQQRLDAAAMVARDRASVMMKRYLGSQRMKADADAAMANGVDQRTAMQNALLNNAHLLFADNPEALSNLINRETQNQIRENALQQRALEFDRRSSIIENGLKTRATELDRRNDLLNKAQEERERNNKAIDERARQGLIDKSEAEQAKMDLKREQLRADTLQKQINEEGRNTRAQAADIGKNKRALARAIANDKDLAGLRADLNSKQDLLNQLTAEAAHPAKWFGRTADKIAADKTATEAAIKDLNKSIQDRTSAIREELGIDDEESSPAAAVPPTAATNDVLNIGRFTVRRK